MLNTHAHLQRGRPTELTHEKRPREAAAAPSSPSSGEDTNGAAEFNFEASPAFMHFIPPEPPAAPTYPSVVDCQRTVPVHLREGEDFGETFPRAAYRSRHSDVKSAIHWGQRKLFLSEVQLLSLFAERGVPHWIVYVGAAPGAHILYLDGLYSDYHGTHHTWELIDPGAWNERLRVIASKDPRFTLRNEFFNNQQAYALVMKRLQKARCPSLGAVYASVTYDDAATAAVADDNTLAFEEDVTPVPVKPLKPSTSNGASGTPVVSSLATDGKDAEAARTNDIPVMYEAPKSIPWGLQALLSVAAERVPMLFVSDVRSGREDHGNFEEHVKENTRAQELWVDIINPTFAMLKFRLPYSFVSRYSFEEKRQIVVKDAGPPATLHPDGCVLLPIWTRPTSTETRLVVPASSPKRLYHHQTYEDQMFFFNAVLREKVHFDHAGANECVDYVDHRFDGAAEIALLQQYLQKVGQAPVEGPELRKRLAALVKGITGAIGGSFDRAIANRDQIAIDKGQRAGWAKAVDEKLRRATEYRSLPLWWRNVPAATAQGGAGTKGYTERVEGSEADLCFDPHHRFIWRLAPVCCPCEA